MQLQPPARINLKHPPLPNLEDVDLKLLRIFMAVVRNRGFSAAQLELNINQPTISTYMGQLETRLGLVLCRRGRRGFELTREGEQVYDAAQRFFASLEVFRGEVASTRGQLVGELHIGVVDAVATNPKMRIKQALREFTKFAENVHIVLNVKAPHTLQRELMEERLHMAIAPFDKLPSKLNVEPLVTEKQVLCCGSEHPLFGASNLTTSECDLSQHKFVNRNYQSWSHELLEDTRIGAATGSMEAIAMLIRTGNFLGYLPKHYAHQWIQSGEMRILFEKDLSYNSQFVLAYRKSETNLSAKRLIECFQTSFSPEIIGVQKKRAAASSAKITTLN